MPESCGNRGAVPNPQANPGLVADCEVLLSAKDVLAGTGKLNWSVNLDVRDWEGITIGESRNRVMGLDLADNQLTGKIPGELGGLPYLTHLWLNDNQLTGEIPEELSSLPYLTSLWLSDNQLTDDIPAELGNLTQLEQLSLFANQLTGEIPVELGSLANLTWLLLGKNQLTGEIPTDLGNLESLQHLYLSGNRLTGCIPVTLRKVYDNDLNELGIEFCSAITGTTIRIGVMESLTGPGETYGTVAKQAKQMAVDEINAAGGIDGRMIELVIEDSKYNAHDAITAYRKLTDVEGVKIILGPTCSGAMLGAASLAEEEGVILFSGVATNPDIAEAGDYIFRTSMSDAQLGIDTGNLLWADGIRKLATINESTNTISF